MTPFPQAQQTGIPLEASANALVASLDTAYAVQIATAGQDWGATEAAQTANIGAVQQALGVLPAGVLAAVSGEAARPLTFLSNGDGRTLSGWQPYGSGAPPYYTSSDQPGDSPANEVVLRPGADVTTIVHELLHAYQFRAFAPGDYVTALESPEIRSFMAETGWRQTASDEQVLAAAAEPWATVNAMFAHEGRPLSYIDGAGETVTLEAGNPLEAYATAGSLYFVYRASGGVPDWPEYWSWFDSNLR
jgi:hypothetical protein